jgi:signal transduction histidine kinase
MSSVAQAAPLRRVSVVLGRRYTARRLPTWLWLTLWAAVAAAETLALLPLLDGAYRQIPAVYVVMRLVGGSFAVCGLIAWRRRPDHRSGPLMTATGFAFFVTPLLTQIDSPVTYTLAFWFPDLWLPFFVALLLTLLTGGRLRTRVDRLIVTAVAVAILVPARLLFHDVEGNLLLVDPDPGLATAMGTAQRVVVVVALLATVAVVAARFRAASPAGRRALLPSVAGAVCLVLWMPVLVRDYLRGYRFVLTAQAIDWVVAISVAVVPLVFLAGLLRSRLARGGLADLFRRLHDLEPAQLQTALARAVGDPGLVIGYRRPDGSLIDAAGAPVAQPEAGDRSVAWVRRDGRPVAALVYDSSLDDDPELVEATQAAAAVALEHRDLHAAVDAQLAELRASRERIIAAGDAERRRIERNLHDGAQQRLVLLALQMSEIQRQIRADPAGAEQLVTSAGDELARSLTELRELARGLHPAALDHGLDVALDALAMTAAVPTTVDVQPGPPMPEPVALAAYFVTSEALTNIAKYARATRATVRVSRPAGRVVVEITDDGIGGADPAQGTGLRGLRDRVEALDGSLRVAGRPGGGTVVTAEIPLAGAGGRT